MSKWIDNNSGAAMATAAERKGGFIPIICLDCGGLKCKKCDNDGVIMVEAKNAANRRK